MIQHLINHIAFVVDASGSMDGLTDEVVKVFDNQIKVLATRSKELDQETRVSVYTFDEKVKCLVYDIDVLRLPSIKNFYKLGGSTALVDGTMKALDDLAKLPEIYGDHAFLLFALTDGYENASSQENKRAMPLRIASLPSHWTVGVFVPNAHGISEAKKFGFPASNISVWNTSEKGLSDAGSIMTKSTESFMQGRATGVRGTKNLFQLDTSNLNQAAIQSTLTEVDPGTYDMIPVRAVQEVKPFVETWQKTYRTGAAYYQLSKTETIQPQKFICIQNKQNGKVYKGSAARQLLGLPTTEVKVKPTDHTDFNIFVQSTAPNRKLMPNTQLLYFK